MRLRDKIKAGIKGFSGGGNWVDSNAPGNLYSSGRNRFYWIPGTQLNWDNLTGELWTCPAVQACLNWILRNFNQAPPVVREKNANGVWQNSVDHPLISLINRPNEYYDGTVLTYGIITSIELSGNAYVVVERDGTGKPRELWWVPHHLVTPYTKPESPNQFVTDEYRINMPGGPRRVMKVPPSDMIHLTYGRDPLDPRVGLSPLASLARDINTLQQLATYKPTVLRNFGVIGKWISPKNNEVEIDPQEIKDKIDSQSQADNAGGTVVMDFAADLNFPGVSPKDLDAPSMGDMSECNVAACMGLHQQLVGLYSGRLQKTDASIKEHREEAWEGKLIPLGSIIGTQFGNRLLLELAMITDTDKQKVYLSKFRMEYDYTDIRPLQPDLDALNRRELLVFQAGITTVGQFCENTHRAKPDPKIAGLYWQDLNPATTNSLAIGSGAPQNSNTAPKMMERPDMKASAWEKYIEEELAKLEGETKAHSNGKH